jgi:response regulator RpfG family c-di-GMP phosphodiesterase
MKDQTVLFVDDEENVVKSLNRLLRKERYEFLTASSGHEGLAILRRQPVQVVLSDQKMPDMTGTEFLQEVKRLYPDTVRIVISGDANLDSILESINKGEVYRFLTKPWNDKELKVTIQQCLDQHHLLQENRKLLEQIKGQNEELKEINEKLEQRVSERTQSLRYAQDMLAALPVPVIGISNDGFVVYMNNVASSSLPINQKVSLGSDIRDIFPNTIAQKIQGQLSANRSDQAEIFEWNDFKLTLRIRYLKDGQSTRGCMMVFDQRK